MKPVSQTGLIFGIKECCISLSDFMFVFMFLSERAG